MKTRIVRMIGVLATVLCLALTGCDMGNTPDAQPTGTTGTKRTVRIIISTGAESLSQTNSRTVGPWNPNFAYSLTFTAEGKPSVGTTVIGNAGEVLLSEGIWTLNVIGWQSGPTLAESDPVTVTVSAQEDPPTISVPMHPVLDGEAGTFSCSISVYGDITEVSAVLTPRNVGNAEQSEIALDIEAGENTVSVAPGYYRLTIRAVKGHQPLIRREAVHIYSYTETYASYYLTETDFAPAIYLGGTITNGFEGYNPVAVIAYEDAEGSVLIDESAVTDDVWKLIVEDTLVYCKVRLEKDGAVYYSKPTLVNGFPVSGKTDLVLPVEAYTVTFDANGGFFEGGGTVITMTALENETLTPPPVPQGERVFSGWYSAGKSFTAETRITGTTTAVYAGWLIDSADIADYLANAPGGDSPAAPVLLPLNYDLANGGWEALLSALDTVGKYAELALSACTMTGTEFDPGTSAGVDRVTALILPNTAKSIKAGTSSNATFKVFTAIRSISGAGVETVGDYAFTYCESLTTVSLPVATTIGEGAFNGCTSLASVSLPAATTTSGGAFSDCRSLTEVYLPLATTIGNLAFNGCTSLASVSLPAAQTIGMKAFYKCESLRTVSLPVATSIGAEAFSDCESLTEVSLPAATSIGARAFAVSHVVKLYSMRLRSVSLPAATTIGDYAFRECESLTSVSLPVAMTIGDGAFRYCTSLTTVSIPLAMTIGDGAFASCLNLTTITIDPANTALTAHGGMVLNKTETTLIAYPSATGDITLPSVTEIGAEVFSGCENLTSANLPVATTIGAEAFYYCENLTSVNLPVATTIGTAAFLYCRSLKEVNLSAAETIGAEAFVRCISLESVNLPVVTTIAANTFWLCVSLTSVSLPAVTSIADSPVYRFPSMVSYEDGGAFRGCASLEAVSLPAATYIGDGAFLYCDSLTEVSLPAATSIGDAAFSNCQSLTTVSLPVATTIGDAAFSNCQSLTEVYLPLATTIGFYAFQSCNLTEVSLPKATTIDGGAFSWCESLASVSLPATPPSIGNSIFSYTSWDSSGTIIVRVPASAVSAYTSAWGVDANTPAGDNTEVYGEYHPAVIITDAAQ
ncbi:MAG: leucine-rich repeat protein [Treponema sp.]|jgi:hypothetical protein|nr:leucine-rich repeat protein [Treponema sp.]